MRLNNDNITETEFDKMIIQACNNHPMPSQQRINSVKENISNSLKKTKHNYSRHIKYVAAAACIALAVFIATPSGIAAAGKLYRHIFPDNNNVVISLEGNDEKSNYKGEIVEYSSDSGLADYGIHIDESRYNVNNKQNVLTITPNDYTEQEMKETPVYMTVTQTTLDRESILAAESDKLKAKNPVVFNTETSELLGGSDRIHAQWFAEDDYQWNGDVENVYIADNGKGGAFIITIHYFAECAEGHAARMTYMANTITVFDN